MHRLELAETLIALVEAIEPPPSSGLIVTEALLEVPMEISSVLIKDRLIFFAAPPHSRWKAGVLPPTHRTVLRMELVEGEDGTLARGGER